MKMCEWYILITHDNCTCIFHDKSKLFSSAHEVYRFRRALPCFYPGKVTVTIIRSKRGGMFKMLLWDFWQRIGHELINIHLGTDDSPFVVRPWSYQLNTIILRKSILTCMSWNYSFSVMHWDIIMCSVSNVIRENALDNEAYSLIKSWVAMKKSHW